MADPSLITLTIPETHALADRLFNRGIPQFLVGPNKARIKIDGPSQLIHGLVVAPRIVEMSPQIGVDDQR